MLWSDEQMPGNVTRGPGARVAARLGGRFSDLVWEASTTTAADRRRAVHRPRGKPNLSHAHTPGTSGTGPGEPGTGATQVRRPGDSRSREFCNLPGRKSDPGRARLMMHLQEFWRLSRDKRSQSK